MTAGGASEGKPLDPPTRRNPAPRHASRCTDQLGEPQKGGIGGTEAAVTPISGAAGAAAGGCGSLATRRRDSGVP